jgi:5-dehydro-4-deoxyglucarate dehydratase
MTARSIDEIRATLSSGLLSFPVTDFDRAGALDPQAYRRRLAWLIDHRPAAIFVAGGTGEFFSLTLEEYCEVVSTAVAAVDGCVPVFAAAGYGTQTAIHYAREAYRLGADGILLLPPYLTEAPQAGLRAHVSAICQATPLPLIVYNRANCRLTGETLAEILSDCPNLIGVKDGIGDAEVFLSIRVMLGERLICLNGMPTAEIHARSYYAMGASSYSSAVFNFAPRTALEFYRAVVQGDHRASDLLLRTFFLPYSRIRSRGLGYSVSIVKAGAEIVGRSAGAVRRPLSALPPADHEELAALIERLGPQD